MQNAKGEKEKTLTQLLQKTQVFKVQQEKLIKSLDKFEQFE